jgi:hypothetical protein
VDTSLIQYNGYWYLFASEAERQDMLYLYYSQTLDGLFIEHPASPIVKHEYDCARPGGRLFVDTDGRLLRFAQNLQTSYGGGVCIAQITKLTPWAYSETRLGFMSSLYSQWNTRRVHHVDAHLVPTATGQKGFVFVFDGDNVVDKFH